jgi:hypothetical protein
MDGTCWAFLEAPRRILEEKGKDTVKLRSQRGEKISFTAFGGISYSGKKLHCG